MGKYQLIVLTDAVAGREDEYNDWYTKQHLGDVLAVRGITSAQRFKLRALTMGAFRNKYLAIYEIDADDPEKVVNDLMVRWGTEAMVMSDAINIADADVALFEECSQKVAAQAGR